MDVYGYGVISLKNVDKELFSMQQFKPSIDYFLVREITGNPFEDTLVQRLCPNF